MSGRFAGPSRRPRPSSFEADLVARLRALPAGAAPRPIFRTELRAQLVAITSRIVAESAGATAVRAARGAVGATRSAAETVAGSVAGTSGAAGAGPDAGKSSAARRRLKAGSSGLLRAVRRPVLTFAAAAAVLVVLLGAAVWMSSGSLPGDSLYGVKRASENVQLSLASGNVDKGYTYLGFAQTRVKEASKLLGKPVAAAAGVSASGAQVSDRTAKLVSQTLDSADSDSRSGIQLLGRETVAQMSADPLTKLAPWVSTQRVLLTDIQSRAPAGSLPARTQQSLSLLARISQRAQALKSEVGCPCLARAISDDLGPVPCSPCTSLAGPGGAGSPGAGPTGTGSGGSGSGGSGGTASPGTGSGSSGAGSGLTASGGPGSTAGSGGVSPTGVTSTVPTIPGADPSVLPSAPVSVGTGGISASLPGGIGGGISKGGVSLSVPGVTSASIPGLP